MPRAFLRGGAQLSSGYSGKFWLFFYGHRESFLLFQRPLFAKTVEPAGQPFALANRKKPPAPPGKVTERIAFSVDPAVRLDRASVVRPVVPAADRPGRAVDPAFADRRRLAGRPDRHHLGFAGRGAVGSNSLLHS